MKTYAKMAIVLAIAMAAVVPFPSVADEPGIQMMQRAEAAEGQTDEWTFISADERYGKFYDPHRVHVVANADVKGKLVPTSINAVIKTTYTYAGAQETIDNYGIGHIITNPGTLKYSYASVLICPQERTIEYAQEDFYDESGKIIWSKVYTERKRKEINSRSFDEDFYDAVVDTVFHFGEEQRRKAPDRWRTLYVAASADGSATKSIADTTTMRMSGDNIFFWEWVEYRDSTNTVRDVKFMKKAVNLREATQRVMKYQMWNESGWKDATAELSQRYKPIRHNSYEWRGLENLRAFAKGYSRWLHRYSTEN